MSTPAAQPDRQDTGTPPVTMLRGGQARSRQATGTKPQRKAVSLKEDTQQLIWDAADQLGMENDPVVKAALRLLIKTAKERGIRRKTQEEMIDEIVGGDS